MHGYVVVSLGINGETRLAAVRDSQFLIFLPSLPDRVRPAPCTIHVTQQAVSAHLLSNLFAVAVISSLAISLLVGLMIFLHDSRSLEDLP